MSKTIVLGLGNPILGDDGIGWRVAEELGARIASQDVEIDFHSGGGIALMERLEGYDKAILVDAIMLGDSPIGTVHCYAIDDLPDPQASHTCSPHDTTLQRALQIGQSLNLHLPSEVTVVGIETQRVFDFSDDLSPEVMAAIPGAISLVEKLINNLD